MKKAWLIIAAVAVLLMLPSFLVGPLAVDSAVYNAVWTQQFGEALGRGELYPRWLPGSFEGLGSPTFFFYPPLAFYLTGALTLAGASVDGAINIAGLLVLLASGAAMYGWLRFKGGRALLGAGLYMAAPYHLIDFYSRAALAEFSAFVWLPLIALAIEAWPRRWAGPLLATSFAGLVLTHMPMAVLTGLALIAPMVGREALRRRRPDLLFGYGFAGVAALCLAAVYLVPALTLQGHVSSEVLWSALYQPNSWSPYSRSDVVTPAVLGWPLPLAALSVTLAVGAAIAARRQGVTEARFWTGVTIVCALLGLALIPGVWLLPVVEKVQFPWRIFAVMEFAAVSAVALAPGLPRRALQVAAVFAAAAYVRIVVLGVHTVAAGPLPPAVAEVLPDAAEYLPAGFDVRAIDHINRQPDLAPYRGGPVQGAISRVEASADGTLSLVVTAPGPVVVRRFAFPAWQVVHDGVTVPSHASGPGRLLTFEATPGRYDVVRAPLPQERWGLWLSLAGLLLTASFWLPWAVRRATPDPKTRQAEQ